MTSGLSIRVVEADLATAEHARVVRKLTDAYARDPLGNGASLGRDVLDRLVPGLLATPTSIVFLAYAGDEPAGIATCFRGFSTFKARPLLNIHDVGVRPEYRGRGVGHALVSAAVAKARVLGCCRVTLEVQERNGPARRLYEREGFVHAHAKSSAGGALFFMKDLL
jgi:GNAT superfamily N-acetyltransferase